MGDRVWASIRFSGTVTPEQAAELVEALGVEGLIEANADPEEVDFNQWFEGCEVNYGNFEEVENVCGDLGVTYLKRWDSGYEFPAGIELYRPDAETLSYGEIDGEPAISFRELTKAITNDTLNEEVEKLRLCAEFDKLFPPLEVKDLVTIMEAS